MGEADFVWTSQRSNFLHDVLAQLLLEGLIGSDIPTESHEAGDRLSFNFVRPPNNGCLGHLGMMYQRALDLHGAQSMAGHIQDVVDSSHDPKVTVIVTPRSVCGEIGVRDVAPVLL